MTKIIALDVGQAGFHYIETALSAHDGLAEKACALPIRRGRVVALVPEGTSLERATEFRYGDLTRDGASLDAALTGQILSLGRPSQDSALIVQDPVSHSTYPYIVDQCAEDGKFFYRSTVYWVLNGPDFDQESITDTISLSRGFTTLTFYVRCRVDLQRFMNREVSAEVIADFASHIEAILISAYDDESSVIWRPIR
jgi:hypothetical protein